MAELQIESGEERAKKRPRQRHNNGGVSPEKAAVGTKRQRRPSVRLGDIGGGDVVSDYYYYDHHQPQRRRVTKQQQHSKARGPLGNVKSSKETLTSIVDDNAINITNDNKSKNNNKNNNKGKKRSCSPNNDDNNEDTDGDLDGIAIGSWKIKDLKSKRGAANAKRARAIRASELDTNRNQKPIQNGDDEINRSFEPINFEDEEEEQEEHAQKVHENGSPIYSLDNNNNNDDVDETDRERDGENLNFDGRKRVGRVSNEMDEPSDSSERNGVRVWLNKLGLGRYAPIFEIHEVDDEVLPLLTLEDLKDMGITAVGSRRKMYCSIQKLKEGPS